MIGSRSVVPIRSPYRPPENRRQIIKVFINIMPTKTYSFIAAFKQKASFHVREACDIVVGEIFAGLLIIAELSAFVDITYSIDIVHEIFRMGNASNIVFRTSDG